MTVIILGIVLITSLIFLSPLKLTTHVLKNENSYRLNVSIFWVFTKFGITFEIFEKSINLYLRILKYSILVKSLTSDKKKPKEEKEKKKTKLKKPFVFRKYIPLLKKMFTPILTLLNRLYKSYRFSRINVRAEIGMNDPANLGIMYGLYCSGSYLLPECADIRIKPNFQRNVFIGDATLELMIFLHRIWIALIIFGVLIGFHWFIFILKEKKNVLT